MGSLSVFPMSQAPSSIRVMACAPLSGPNPSNTMPLNGRLLQLSALKCHFVRKTFIQSKLIPTMSVFPMGSQSLKEYLAYSRC